MLDNPYPDDPYTRWRLSERAAYEADELAGMRRLPLWDQDEQLELPLSEGEVEE